MVDPATDNPPLRCITCGGFFAAPADRRQSILALIEEESARCQRLREIGLQRQTLAARIQAGVAGTLGGDTVETNDLVAQRQSLAQLDAALMAEAAALANTMVHVPAQGSEGTHER
jgi:hypothetical protein